MSSLRLYAASLVVSGVMLWDLSAQAQLIPDQTLGGESSIISADDVRGELADLIEGGATRGTNLFHSFSEFNVNDAQRVYFANPINIESILSRVTGNNASDIRGTLGVDGSADLFLINPNGIIFGPDVSLDIDGSFYATTAESVEIGDGVFSAIAPEQSQLLAISPSVSFWNYLTANSGDITNRGQLVAGSNLVLAGNSLALEAQLAGLGNVSLLATDTVKIRDTAETPFIAAAGADLLVQGNEQVDIVALSHPDSQLFSYGDMVLRSTNAVSGDTHFFSGGNFRIENLDNTLSNLTSPVDPIIRSLGDVAFDSYLGSSLHIIAGGSVTFNEAIVIAPDPGIQGIDFLQDTLELADGTIVEIDGGSQPTVDIRAGVRPDAIGILPIPNPSGLSPFDSFTDGNFFFPQPVAPTLTADPSDANIEVGSIRVAESNGLILLTNRYEPNTALPGGGIQVVGNDPTGFGFDQSGINITAVDAGSIFLDSRGDITVTDTDITLLGSNSTGDLVLVAEGDITLADTISVTFPGLANNIAIGGQGTAGEIRVTARNLSVLNGAQIDGTLFGNGEASNITLNISNTALLQGVNPSSGLSSGIVGFVGPGSQGRGSEIQVTAENLLVLDGAQINASTFGVGDAGNIRLEIRENVRFDGLDPRTFARSGVFSNIQRGRQGQAGDIYIEADNFELLNGATLRSSTFGIGDAGNITLNIRETARFDSNDAVLNFSGVFTGIQPNAQGQAGEIRIEANDLEVLGGTVIAASNFGGVGNAGNVIFDIRGTARFDQTSQATSEYDSSEPGRGGNVVLRATNLDVLNGAILSANSFGIGDAGNVILNIRETARFEGRDPIGRISGATSDIGFDAVGNGGDVRINAGNLEVLNGARLSTSLAGIGTAGDIILDIRETAQFDGIDPFTGESSGVFSTVVEGGQGKGGDIELSATNLEVRNRAQIGSGISGIGEAGDVTLNIRETARIEDFRNPTRFFASGIFGSIGDSGVGQGGDIRFDAANLILDGAQIFSGVRGRGEGGDIFLTIRDTLRLENSNPGGGQLSGIFSGLINTAGGQGGDIRVATEKLEIFEGSIGASSDGDGDAGNILVIVQDDIQARNGSITTDSAFNAGGQIQISSDNIFLFEDSDIQTFVNSGANDGGDIEIVADALVALDDSDILAFAADGRGGDVDLSRTAFFGENFQFTPSGTDPRTLDGNDRVDINATGGIASGTISLADVSFIEDSLTELPDNLVNPETLVAGSCISRSSDVASSLVITGSDSLPQQPNSSPIQTYSVNTVQPIEETIDSSSSLTEPQAIYRLIDGRLVMSRNCDTPTSYE
ncbi:two-partner secretion domain-containing protein [Leptolyngbya sp. Heron Island J]|uniref:two-partner secretion domain-containing protein n=1 Tax=Leptolyngbya sp. Heron Island J TaxID=1385935 RepID=UPI0013775D82|nr:filamentous hemagglutinin N-terminal domain-containing protein [Leptolyngbya sp. Heron Island J]